MYTNSVIIITISPSTEPIAAPVAPSDGINNALIAIFTMPPNIILFVYSLCLPKAIKNCVPDV